MKELAMKLRILWRAEMTLFKAEAQRRTDRSAWLAICLICILVAIVFVNVGLFYWLTDADGDSTAAFILAAGNLGLAILPFLMSRRIKPGPEEEMVVEIRDMAMEQITKDVDDAAQTVTEFSNSVNQLKSGITSFSSRGIAGMGPVLTMAIDMLKKGKK